MVRVLDGAEPTAFTQWASSWEGPKKIPQFIPKLYQCSDQNGRLTIEEICNYTQEVSQLETNETRNNEFIKVRNSIVLQNSLKSRRKLIY